MTWSRIQPSFMRSQLLTLHCLLPLYRVSCLGARSQIFLTGPWVSPDLSLLRPPHRHPGSRLDRLLEQKAKEGVHIYVLLFKEPQDMAVNSKYSEGRFNALDHRGHIHVRNLTRSGFKCHWSVRASDCN